jgi:hypothetical protein
MKTHYISCNKFTVRADTVNGIITDTADLTHKFIGQRINNLISWAKKFGGLRHEFIK